MFFMLKQVHTYLSSHQKFYVAGAFAEQLANTSWFVEGNNSRQPDPAYSCNAEETDTMLWLHAKRTNCNKILVLSPDTDVYMIGLPLQCTKDKDIIVQISDMNSRELKLLYMKRLTAALSNDPDLASVAAATHTKVVQTLFVVTGCDYISFFQWNGESNFLAILLSACRVYNRRVTVHAGFIIRHTTGQSRPQARIFGLSPPHWHHLF